MSDNVSDFFREHIDAARGLTGKPLERAISGLLRDFQGHIWGWTKAACRTHSDREFMFADDVFNVISLELSIELRKELQMATDPPIVNFYAYFTKISQRESFAFFHSGERTGFSNASGATRRASKINKTRKELSITIGREPTDQEVVDEVNRLAYATRSDPKKQGALVTLDDLKVTSFASLDGLTEDFGDSIWATEESDDAPLSGVEAPVLIKLIIEGCREASEVLGDVAEAWIGSALSAPPVVRSEREIAALMTLKQGVVSELLEDCRSIALAVCSEKFSIDSPFV